MCQVCEYCYIWTMPWLVTVTSMCVKCGNSWHTAWNQWRQLSLSQPIGASAATLFLWFDTSWNRCHGNAEKNRQTFHLQCCNATMQRSVSTYNSNEFTRSHFTAEKTRLLRSRWWTGMQIVLDNVLQNPLAKLYVFQLLKKAIRCVWYSNVHCMQLPFFCLF